MFALSVTNRFLRGTVVCAGLFGVGAASLPAQPPSAAALPLPATPPDVDASAYVPTLTFDVASVRPTERGPQITMGIVNPSHKSVFSASTVSLQMLIQLAYAFGPFQIAGGPDWREDRYFTVEAKADPSVDAKLAGLTDDQGRLEKLHMVQALLADRFQMRAHWETKQTSVFVLTVAKGGVKMTPTKAPAPAGDNSMAPTTPTTGVHAHGGPQGIEIDGERFSMRAIALMLSSQLHVPVVDKTGDSGVYDFTFQFSRDAMGATRGPDAYPDVMTAAAEELGLKLDQQKGPTDVMVIDHAELPSQN